MSHTILALDTTTEACSVACWQCGKVIAEDFLHLGRGHAEALTPMIASTIAQSGLGYDEFDAIAVTIGPGTFTGLRIGLAAARGLALAMSKPMIGVTTLEAVAYAARSEQRSVLAILDARRSQLYAQGFDPMLMPLSAPSVVSPECIQSMVPEGPYVAAGTGVALARPYLLRLADSPGDVTFDAGDGFPRAAVVARIASMRPPAAATTVHPMYLRPPDAIPSQAADTEADGA